MTGFGRLAKAGAGWLALTLLLGGCAGEHTTGALAPPLPPAAPRAALARSADGDHAALLRAFGGEVRAPAAQALLAEMVARLEAKSERPGESFEVTILNSPAVNAFALPSRRLYVTRGLLALSGSASEVAAVMAHEMAHVARRHADQRGEFEARSILVSRVVSDVLGDQAASASVWDRSRLSLAQFSREQEFEADEIGVATVAAAGYDPEGAARSLRALARHAALDAQERGGGRGDGAARLSTHPATEDRLARVQRAARRLAAAAPERAERAERARYLAAIEGLPFGDNPADGIVRGRRFLHPRLGVAFEAPDGYVLENSPRAVSGATPDGGRRLLFDAVESPDGTDLADLLRTSWSDALDPTSVRSQAIEGRAVATAASRSAEWSFRLGAVRIGPNVYRVILAAKGAAPDLERDFGVALGSVRELGRDEASAIRPQRIALVEAGPDDTVATLAARMTTSRPLERFLLLNSLDRGDALRPGERYKVVVD
jgi:predicted Zn-dependent protease